MPGIFISYRREDSPGHAGRLFDRLSATFGRDIVFMDVSAIEAGLDFVDAIEDAVGSCDVLLAVIGREWVDSKDTTGRRRLENSKDFIRIEIATALHRNVRVIPVLVRGAVMPDAEALPPDLERLTRRQAVELRDTRWDADVDDLIIALRQALASMPRVPATSPPVSSDAAVPSPVAASPPATVPSPTPVPPLGPVARPATRSRLLVAAAAAIILLGGVALWRFGPALFNVSPSGGAAPVSTNPSGPPAKPTNVDPAIKVPNLVGVDDREAGRLITDAGLKLGAPEKRDHGSGCAGYHHSTESCRRRRGEGGHSSQGRRGGKARSASRRDDEGAERCRHVGKDCHGKAQGNGVQGRSAYRGAHQRGSSRTSAPPDSGREFRVGPRYPC